MFSQTGLSRVPADRTSRIGRKIIKTEKRHFGEIISSESPDTVDRERSAFEQTMRKHIEKTKKRGSLLTFILWKGRFDV